jgi:NADH dehydrogenase
MMGFAAAKPILQGEESFEVVKRPTVGNPMGFLTGRDMLVEGFVAGLIYRSRDKMHGSSLHGLWTVGLDTIACLLTRGTEPHVKLS